MLTKRQTGQQLPCPRAGQDVREHCGCVVDGRDGYEGPCCGRIGVSACGVHCGMTTFAYLSCLVLVDPSVERCADRGNPGYLYGSDGAWVGLLDYHCVCYLGFGMWVLSFNEEEVEEEGNGQVSSRDGVRASWAVMAFRSYSVLGHFLAQQESNFHIAAAYGMVYPAS